jgi:hypothetical protein
MTLNELTAELHVVMTTSVDGVVFQQDLSESTESTASFSLVYIQ